MFALPLAAAGFAVETAGSMALRLALGGMSIAESITHLGRRAKPWYEGKVKFFTEKSLLQPAEEEVDGSVVSGVVIALSANYRVQASDETEAREKICARFIQDHPSQQPRDFYVLPASFRRV